MQDIIHRMMIGRYTEYSAEEVIESETLQVWAEELLYWIGESMVSLCIFRTGGPTYVPTYIDTYIHTYIHTTYIRTALANRNGQISHVWAALGRYHSRNEKSKRSETAEQRKGLAPSIDVRLLKDDRLGRTYEASLYVVMYVHCTGMYDGVGL